MGLDLTNCSKNPPQAILPNTLYLEFPGLDHYYPVSRFRKSRMQRLTTARNYKLWEPEKL